jgi:hypothetical protein
MNNPMPSKIMLIRHAEKPADEPPPHGVTLHGAHDSKALSVRGWTRAGALAARLAPANARLTDERLATPNVVYAMGIGAGSESARPQQTVQPLVEKLGAHVETNFYFLKGQEQELIASVLDCAGVVLVCWEHERLAHAARHIPLSVNNREPLPAEWDAARYDMVWIFDLDAHADGYIFSPAAQRALAGDL